MLDACPIARKLVNVNFKVNLTLFSTKSDASRYRHLNTQKVILHSELLLHYSIHADRCADGSCPANCLINPCEYATCPAVEGATCVADQCEGCSAKWLLNGQEVTIQCIGEHLCYK